MKKKNSLINNKLCLVRDCIGSLDFAGRMNVLNTATALALEEEYNKRRESQSKWRAMRFKLFVLRKQVSITLYMLFRFL